MATEGAQCAPEGARSAEERCAYVLLHAPGSTGSANEPVRGGAWLQEQVRMVARAVPGLGIDPDGVRIGEIGPALAAALDRGAAEGLVSRDVGGGICLTPRGRREAESLWEGAGRRAREAASWTKGLLNDTGYWELVSFARSASPGAATGPGIAGEIGKRRLESAVGLAKRHKVSITKAADIAGIGVEEFEAELKGRGMPPYSLDWKRHEESLRLVERITGR